MGFVLIALSVFVAGQGGGPCGSIAFDSGGGAWTNPDASGGDPLAPLIPDPDPLAPLTPEPDPLAPLVNTPRGACGLWVGKLTGTRHWVKTVHYECPWQGGGHDTTDSKDDTTHTSSIDMMFPDAFGGADKWGMGISCAPTGSSSRALSTGGTVTYTRHWYENYDYGDECGRYHNDAIDETFSFAVKAEDVQMWVTVHASTYTEQQAIIAERPCRTDYPVEVMIMVDAPASGGSGTSVSTETSGPCHAPETTTKDEHAITANSAASYIAILYGTYHIAANGSDTIEASRDTTNPVNPDAASGCSGVNDACSCQSGETLTEQYTLSLTRFPEGDRDMDGECDSVDPCPDAAFENECDNTP